MRRIAFRVLLICVLSAVLTGCRQYSLKALGPGTDVVSTSVEAMGGLEAWQNVKDVEAICVATVHAEGGSSHVLRMEIEMDFRRGRIEAEGDSPQGNWSAVAWRDGDCSIDGPAPMDEQGLGEVLAIILHRVAGPLNLCLGTEEVLTTERARLGGHAVDRVGTSEAGVLRAYYVDASSRLLRYVTCGDETPGGDGTVTTYGGREAYTMLPNGLTLPKTFSVNRTGEKVLLGRKPVLTVELTDVETD